MNGVVWLMEYEYHRLILFNGYVNGGSYLQMLGDQLGLMVQLDVLRGGGGGLERFTVCKMVYPQYVTG